MRVCSKNAQSFEGVVRTHTVLAGCSARLKPATFRSCGNGRDSYTRTLTGSWTVRYNEDDKAGGSSYAATRAIPL